MCDYIIDSEFKAVIPPLSDKEYEQLEENLLNEGCREPLTVWNSVLIDGHNRYEICNKHSIEFDIVEMDFSSRDEAKQWIIKNQFGRRNLTDYDRGVLALKMKEMIAAKAKENQKLSKGRGIKKDLQNSANLNEPINTREEIAKAAGISHDTIHKVETIEREAPEAVKQAAKENIISINKAYNVVKAIKKDPQKEDLFITGLFGEKHPITEEQDEHIKEQFKKITKEVDEEFKIVKSIHEAIFAPLNVDVNEENVKIYFDQLTKIENEANIVHINMAIEKLQALRALMIRLNKIKRVK